VGIFAPASATTQEHGRTGEGVPVPGRPWRWLSAGVETEAQGEERGAIDETEDEASQPI